MNDDKRNEDKGSDNKDFDLSAPSHSLGGGEMGKQPLGDAARFESPVDPRMAAEGRSATEWKGFEEEEEYEPEVGFGSKGVIEDELDMTPMVDVTFLLLIFFMVTASFTLQKSIQQPPLETDEPSPNTVVEPENEDQYVEVIIDQFNTYRLTSKDSEELEAPSDQEMRTRMRDMIDSTMAKRVIITAHGDAFHEKVVTAWDAATDNAISDIIIRLTEEDF